jgi:threonine dehydrogenase-like Zn-dependent dehydrogenase
MSREKVKAMVLESARKIVPREFPMPEIGSRDLLLKMEACGVCGSDPKFYRGELEWFAPYPIILGDEIVGRVAKVGNEAEVKHGVKKGDRVIVNAKIPCGLCEYCFRGLLWFCKAGVTYGVHSCNDPPHLWGGHSEYLYVPYNAQLFKITEELPTEAAIIASVVLGDGIHWVETLGQVKFGDTVVILGPGPQGLASTIMARESGAGMIIVVGISRDHARMKLAKDFGADYVIDAQKDNVVERVTELTDGELAEVVIETAGVPATVKQMIDLAKPLGTCVHISVTGGIEIPLVTQNIVFKELRIQGGLGRRAGHLDRAIQFAERNFRSNKYPLEKMINYRFPLEKTEEALKVMGFEVKGTDPIKAMIDFRDR